MFSLKPILVAAALSLTALPAIAEQLSADDSALLQTRVDSFNAAFLNGDFPEVMSAMPAKMKTFIAENAGVTIEALDAAMIEQTKAAMATVTVDQFDMAMGDATSDVTPEGRPYSLIPTATLMTIENVGKVQGTSSTLAMKDEGKWYLVRIDDENQVNLLRAVYPDFGAIDFPIGTMQVIE
jgi:hypothetical protein